MSTATLIPVRTAVTTRTSSTSTARAAGAPRTAPTRTASTRTTLTRTTGPDRSAAATTRGTSAAERLAARPVRPAVRAARPAPSAGALVLTARGRRVVRLIVLGVATAVLAAGLVLAWVALAATVAPGASAGDGRAGVLSGAGAQTLPTETVAVVVAPGDTLWQLARDHAPERDPRSVVADIVQLNDLGSAGVQAGTEVRVPVG
ncbi:LysM peptidoglycan-binding domain-containing protein [Aquipuribacter hungaricus]|uniref:LysM peptidoglycan-binding domain-containing protein n=1 Tax=Aquipuribacter hungaricus TaxID=545624 RepID=A0ABV7WL97_9MICO